VLYHKSSHKCHSDPVVAGEESLRATQTNVAASYSENALASPFH
jgi:hypothetical protein